MAPEILMSTLNLSNFDEFKMADIYSYALVLWEICCRIQVCYGDLDSIERTSLDLNTNNLP